ERGERGEATGVGRVGRRGGVVAPRPTAETTPQQLAELMVGRTVTLRVDKTPAQPGETVLEVVDLVVEDGLGVRRVKGVSFAVRRGEIVGVAGVAGNGQSELLEALAGIRPAASGQILWKARALGDGDPRSPRRWRQRGLSHVPEDRHRMGLVIPFAGRESAILGYHADGMYNGLIVLHRSAVAASWERQVAEYDIRPGAGLLATSALSGGNH